MADENIHTSVDPELAKESQPNVDTGPPKNTEVDKELDDLLDSALEDFDNPPPAANVNAASSIAQSSTDIEKPTEQKPQANQPQDGDLSQQQEAFFNELFSSLGSSEEGQGAPAGFEDMMKQLMSQAPDLQQPPAPSTDFSLPPEGSGNFEETLQQTLGSLAQNTQNLQNQPSEADLMQMLSGMGLDDGEGGGMGDLDFLPMMQGMMKNLMSKEVLYPSLKEISDKYPAWLEENATKLPEDDLIKYKKQYDFMKSIVTEFEQEKDSDPDDVKASRFTKIMDTMQQMQELGHPPKDLAGDLPPGLELDEKGLPKNLPNMDQCSVM